MYNRVAELTQYTLHKAVRLLLHNTSTVSYDLFTKKKWMAWQILGFKNYSLTENCFRRYDRNMLSVGSPTEGYTKRK